MWYGQCGTDGGHPPKAQNCLYNGPAKPLTDPEGLALLKDHCPWLIGDDETYTCCDTAQLKTFSNQTGQANQLLSRCPSCYRNFLENYCQMTCSPGNSQFVNATTTKTYVDPDTKKNKTRITEIKYYLQREFAEGMYNSCKDVQFPSSNSKVMSLFCGSYGAEHCSAAHWLEFMGNKANGQTPFQIDFTIVNGTDEVPPPMIPMNITVYPCNEGIGNLTAPCSCQDCAASCPPPPNPPPPSVPCLILNVDCATFIMIVTYAGFLVFFFITLCSYYVLCNRTGTSSALSSDSPSLNSDDSDSIETVYKPIQESEISFRERYGEAFFRYLSLFFQKWGTFCASHPFIVIGLTIVLVTVFSVGIKFLVVTTDPVELWSPPESRSRMEKDYFDSQFGPFYRTEQMIITAPTINVTYYETYPFHDVIPFGPVLGKDILHQVSM